MNKDDDWICLCGNTSSDDEFYPCDEGGNEVEPTAEQWITFCYVCAHCGRIINAFSKEVVNRVDPEIIQWLV